MCIYCTVTTVCVYTLLDHLKSQASIVHDVTFAASSGFSPRCCTLLTLLVPLLHGHQGGEVCLVVGQHQWGAVASVGGHLQGQVQTSERDGGKR